MKRVGLGRLGNIIRRNLRTWKTKIGAQTSVIYVSMGQADLLAEHYEVPQSP